MNKISAVILTQNNESTIANCIESVKYLCDEIIIVDDGSVDHTINILEEYPKVKIYHRNLNGNFSSQRNYGISKSSNKWVLILDSDEYLDKELQSSISCINFDDKCSIYTCNRINKNFSRPGVVHLKERPIVMTKSFQFIDKQHERVIYKTSKKIKGNIIHDCWTNLSDFVDDINIYSTRKALQWVEEGRNYSLTYLFFRQIFVASANTFYRLFIQMRILGGYKGILYCLYWASEDLLVGMKYIEKKLSTI
jgi:glycosyltransferase involved in cell wall biosynthesis